LLSIVCLDTHLAKTWLYTHLPEARNNTQTHNNFSLCYLRNRRYSLCFFQVVEVKRTIFIEFSLSFMSVYNLEYTDRSCFFFLFFFRKHSTKNGKIIILRAFHQQLMLAMFFSSYTRVASDAGFPRGCCLNYIFKDTVSNIFSKQILTIILVSGRNHIIIFAFHKIKGINLLDPEALPI